MNTARTPSSRRRAPTCPTQFKGAATTDADGALQPASQPATLRTGPAQCSAGRAASSLQSQGARPRTAAHAGWGRSYPPLRPSRALFRAPTASSCGQRASSPAGGRPRSLNRSEGPPRAPCARSAIVQPSLSLSRPAARAFRAQEGAWTITRTSVWLRVDRQAAQELLRCPRLPWRARASTFSASAQPGISPAPSPVRSRTGLARARARA
ncbi:hypothetical protein BC628DRAFT_1006484 [Trametes gibbosa]|nr:hypothetical protein BC628DRAFT_1006484 [Trametes gibbosa]